MTVEERRRRRFTVDFRKEQVKKIESGEISLEEVCRLYEVQRKNVRIWLKRFGTKPLAQAIIVGCKDEFDRIGDLEKEISSLKQIIAEQQIELIKKSSIVKLAEEKLGNGFEKK